MRGVLLLLTIYDSLLLRLAENTVDLGSADWADALCHAAT